MTFSKTLFSSKKMDWQTPPEVYQYLDNIYHFDFDPCPPDPVEDGLTISWKQSNFINPPYGREIGNWLKKGYEEYLLGKICVFLIPSRTDTKWWRNYIVNKATEVMFITGRLKFKGAVNSAPFPSAIVIYDPNQETYCHDTVYNYIHKETICQSIS